MTLSDHLRSLSPRWWIAGGAVLLLLVLTLGWMLGRAGVEPSVASPAVAKAALPAAEGPVLPLPVADVKSREKKRFARADRDDDGLIEQAEYLANRKKAFDKLDANGDGRLDFAEYAVKTVAKFAGADADNNGRLTAAEFATTAPKPRVKKPVDCPPVMAEAD